MKLFYYVKTILKSMVSSGVVTVIYFILFPILLAGFMGFTKELAESTELKLKSLSMQVVDEDKSEMSNKLKKFLESEEVSDVVTMVDEKPDVELVIKKGYEDNILSLSKDNLLLNRKNNAMEIATNTLKVILDNYHQGLYVSLSGGDINQLNKVTGQSIIENVIVDKPQKESNYEKMAVSMLGFLITMLIFSLLQSGYTDMAMNIDKRVNTAPVTKIQFLIYDSIGTLIYSTILLSLYVMFFRVAGITFKGNIIDLFILIILASLLIVSIAKCITSLFSIKIGKIVSGILFILPIVGGEVFSFGSNPIALLTPTHYVNNAFSMYILNGSLEGTGKWLFIILITSIILFSIAIIKESFKMGRKVCV